MEFCKQNQSLISLDINVPRFADHRHLSEIVGHCPLLKKLKFVLNDNAGEKDYVRLANLDRLQQLEIVKPPSHADIFEEEEEDSDKKRPRIERDSEIKALSEGINQYFESNVALHELLKAISDRKRSLLSKLALKFYVEDEIVKTIAKIKSIRLLECGLCDVNSINHLKDSPVLNRLVLLNKGHLICNDIVHLLNKQVNVLSLDTKMSSYKRGYVHIETNNADIYKNINAEPLLNIDNLECIYLSNDLIELPGFVKALLEKGVQLNSINSSYKMFFEPTRRKLTVYDPNSELPLPVVENLKSFSYFVFTLSDEILLKLLMDHSKTLEEIQILSPTSMFSLDKDVWLHEAQVKILASFTCLKYIACGLKKLKDIQHLVNLTNLEEIEILSEHDPKFVSFSRFLTPVLQKCKKLSCLEIKIVSKSLTRKFLTSLQYIVLKERQSVSQNLLEVCLTLRPKPALTENQVCNTKK